MDCPYCSQITEEAVRQAMLTHVPLKVERVEETSRWLRVDEEHFKLTFFCDACGQNGEIVVQMIDEVDPADWWKSE